MKIDGLKVKYKERTVFDGLSLHIDKTERVAVLGRSGAGKTSLVKALLGLVDFDGTITDAPQFSVVFQEDRLVEELTVKENILLACPKVNVDEVLAKTELSDCKNKKVKTLSGGMKRRTAIARAMSKDCETLIADEPFSGLDLATKIRLSKNIKEHFRGKGIILVTHDLLQAYELCERIIIVDGSGILVDCNVNDFTLDRARLLFEKNC